MLRQRLADRISALGTGSAIRVHLAYLICERCYYGSPPQPWSGKPLCLVVRRSQPRKRL
jgi:hypothetical protein